MGYCENSSNLLTSSTMKDFMRTHVSFTLIHNMGPLAQKTSRHIVPIAKLEVHNDVTPEWKELGALTRLTVQDQEGSLYVAQPFEYFADCLLQ